MARRRTTRRRKTTRRRRVSGIGSNDMQVVVGVVIGAIGGSFANTQVAKMTKPIDPKIVAAVEVIGGGFLAAKAKSALVKGVGLGLAATGANTAAKSFGLISGFRALGPINGLRRVAGIADKGFLGYPTPKAQFSGANARGNITPNKFPAAAVISGMAINVNGHGDGSAVH